MRNGQLISNSSTFETPESGGTYQLSVTNSCRTATSIVNVSTDPIRHPDANGGTIIAFDQQVFNGNPMPIYHYDLAGHPNDPIFWFGNPAYNAYGYRLEIYYRWNSDYTISPQQLVRVYESDGCNTLNNGEIQIDGYNSNGNYIQAGTYLFRLWLKDCRGEAFLVNKMWRRKLICNGYTTYWLHPACGYCVVPQKICTSPAYVEEVVDGSGFNNEIFTFFNN